MPAPQGLVLFPGIEQPISATYTLSHGITPGVCTIEMVPQAGFVGEGGTLSFLFDDVELDFPDCKVDYASFTYDGSGFLIALSVLDRRWKWSFGGPNGAGISGSYNTRRDDGKPYPERIKEAIDLAKLCLDALGESDYDISAIPTGVFPVVDWEAELPAQALSELADATGCRIVLRTDNTVALIPAGDGGDLPDSLTIESDSLTINPPERPDKLTYVCGPTRYQMDILLRAVGLDADGQVKRINDLSYKPAAGWEYCDPHSFSAVAADENDLRQKDFLRSLARQTVYRWYQIALEMPDDGNSDQPYTLDVPVYSGQHGAVTKLKQVLLLDEQVELMQDIDGVYRVKPAQVIGIFARATLSGDDALSDTLYWKGFSIDAERGLVMFSDLVYRNGKSKTSSDSIYTEADISLRTAINVRDKDTWAWDRYTRDLDFGTNYGTGAKLYKHEESFLAVLEKYDDDGNPQPPTDNKDAINAEADTYLNAALAEIQTTLPQDRSYAGLLNINPDGAIQQVTWSVGPDGATTRASRNSEHSPNVPLYRTRRFFEQLRNNRATQLAKRVDDLSREIKFRPPRPD